MNKKDSAPAQPQPLASVWLQIGSCAAVSVIFLFGVFLSWLAFEPYSTLLAFLSGWKSVGTILGLLSAIATAWAFVLGWDPKTGLLEKIYAHAFAPLMRHRQWLWGVCAACLALFVAQAALAAHLLQKMPPEPEPTLFAEYDVADKLLQALPPTDERKPLFLAFNEALLHEQLRSSESADPARCEQEIHVLRSSTPALQPIYQRYLRHRAEAACKRVAGSPMQALEELDKMLGVSRFLDPDQMARGQLTKAVLYLQESPTALGLHDAKEAHQQALNVAAQIDLPSSATGAQLALQVAKLRLQGNVSYLERNYGEANEFWAQGLKLLPANTEGPHQQFLVERVRLHGNRVLSLGAAGLTAQAFKEVELAEPAVDRLNLAEVDSHRAAAVRMYSNASLVAAVSGACSSAPKWWARREQIKKQPRSACTAILETVILTCGREATGLTGATTRQVVGDLVFAMIGNADGQAPKKKTDLTQLLDATVTRFDKCYVGLTYPRGQVAKALGL